jgi:hypothetical protein
MTYEEYLDEVTTLIVEKYGLDDAAAIKIVVDAQAADYFVAHAGARECRRACVVQGGQEAVTGSLCGTLLVA